ncbi:Gfo/Idh/MocA family protein [Phytoactinopolyspora limicola]|uniref:Gfo/Idh/MocA family protein n=1 Tax=Phytoactinopolyspora limicola TaxID=2715536 RepID=UPI00140AA034|nr:Gfo/Idh/MocA family oxidoreductase [Phytoactinopolyspora limicola]
MRVLVVGAAAMGAVFARVVCELSEAELCGVVDDDVDAAAELADALGVAWFVDLADAIDAKRPDAAVVATPDHLHREPAEILIEARIPILVEKPLATSMEDAEAIIWLAEKRGVRVMAGHTARFLPRYAQVLDVVQAGELGEPLLITTSSWGPRSIGSKTPQPTDPLWYFGIHDIDLVQWIGGGTVREVDGAHLVESDSGVCTFAAMGALHNDVAFNVVAGWTLPDDAAPRWDLQVHGRHGSVQVAWNADGDGADGWAGGASWANVYGRVGGAMQAELEHFVHALTHDEPFLVTMADAVRAVIGTAILDSAVIIRRVD